MTSIYSPDSVNGPVFSMTGSQLEGLIVKYCNVSSYELIPEYNGSMVLGLIEVAQLDEYDESSLLEAIARGSYDYEPTIFVQYLVNEGVLPVGFYIVNMSW